MNSKPKLTLNQIKQSPKLGRQARASDFLSQEEKQELRRANLQGRRKKKLFNDVDAYIAEMIARFGYDFYLRWNKEELNWEWVDKLMRAERARERAAWLPIEGLIQSTIQGGVPTFTPKNRPKGVKLANQIIKDELKMVRGEK